MSSPPDGQAGARLAEDNAPPSAAPYRLDDMAEDAIAVMAAEGL
jgi:hypothetical protein